MRPEKQFLLDEIQEEIDQSDVMVVLSYDKLDANNTAKFRKEISLQGGSMLVVKKRIFLKAAETAGFSFDWKEMKGHIGLVFSSGDPVSATKAVYKFRQENVDTLQIVGGHFQKQRCSSKDLEKVSKLPSLDQMRSELLGTLEAPAAQTLAVLEAAILSVVYCLENKVNQDSE